MPWEVVNPNLPRGGYRVAVFDFDGTLSLIREGWAGVMANLGLDLLREQNLPVEPQSQTFEYLEDQMLRLSGKPSIFQMRRLAEEVALRGGTPGNPDEYLQEFLRRLFATVDARKSRLLDGTVPPAAWAVPGAHAILDDLQRRGVLLVLASGTDLKYVRQEAELLQLTHYFAPHIYAPENDTPNFSKGEVIAKILRDYGFSGSELIGFGDGYSETVEVKRAGGTVIGLATHEPDTPGVNAMKRRMLIELGADVIIADFAESSTLLEWLIRARSVGEG